VLPPEQCFNAHIAGPQQAAAYVCLAVVVCAAWAAATNLLTAAYIVLSCRVLCDVAF
jgi:hypothetical protein